MRPVTPGAPPMVKRMMGGGAPMIRRRRGGFPLIAIPLMLTALAGSSWSAPQQAAGQASIPTLRVDVEFTTVDVVVLDRRAGRSTA